MKEYRVVWKRKATVRCVRVAIGLGEAADIVARLERHNSLAALDLGDLQYARIESRTVSKWGTINDSQTKKRKVTK